MEEREETGRRGSIKRDLPKKKKRPELKRDIQKNTDKNSLPAESNEAKKVKEQKKKSRARRDVRRDSAPTENNQGYRIKKKKSGALSAAFAYVILFLFVFVIVSSVCAGWFYANLVKVDALEYDSIKIKIGLQHELEGIKAVGVDPQKYFRDGIMYLNMSEIADEFGFIVTGDHKELRFITDSKHGDEVRFMLGTHFAKVNGSSIRLDGKIIKEDGKVYVPAEFVSEYMNGIEFSFDEEKSEITLSRVTSRDENGRFVESDISFRLKFDGDCKSLPEGELTEKQKERTYFKSISADEFYSQNQTNG